MKINTETVKDKFAPSYSNAFIVKTSKASCVAHAYNPSF